MAELTAAKEAAAAELAKKSSELDGIKTMLQKERATNKKATDVAAEVSCRPSCTWVGAWAGESSRELVIFWHA